MTNNFNRKKKRKEGLDQNKENDRRRKEKEREKRQHTARPVKKVRMLADGSIGLGHNFKIGRTGLIVMIGIISLLVLFMGGLEGWFDQFAPADARDKFTAPEKKLISFSECESVDFSNDLCALEYKFCREYSDGGSECTYAEEDPFTNVDPNEAKYTEEEQDFLPPGLDFILTWNFLPEADAVERNHFTIGIYKSKACQALTSLGDEKCPSYQLLVDSFDNTNQGISGEFVWSDEKNDIFRDVSSYVKSWNWYQYGGLPTIIAVDPEAKWFMCCMDARIVVEATDFVFFDHNQALDTGIYFPVYDEFGNQLLDSSRLKFNKNVYIDGCSFARVAANLTLVTQTINYFWNHCEGKSPELLNYLYIPTIPLDPLQHEWYQYNDWLNRKALECRLKC